MFRLYLQRLRLPASLQRYLLVGLLNTAVGLSLTLLLLNTAAMPYGTAALAGNAVGAALSYALNRAYTFRSRASHAASLPRFALVSLACCAAAYALALPLGRAAAQFAAALLLGPGAQTSPGLAHNAAIAIGSVLYTALGYWGHRRFTFRAAPRGLGAAEPAAPPQPSHRLDRLALLAAALVLASLLLVPPLVGVANNGDFERIMGTVGLAYADPQEAYESKYFQYMHSSYALRGLGLGGYISSEIPVVLAATLLNRLLYSSSTFDIRFLGAVYSALFLTAMHLILKSLRLASIHPLIRMATAALLIFIFCDIGYVAYYHSLFGEPISLVFLLLTLGLALTLAQQSTNPDSQPAPLLLAAFFVSAAFLASAKVQTAPVGLLFALLAFRFRPLRSDRLWRRTWLCGTALLIIISVGIYASAPKQLKAINQYQSVFYGILLHSPDPKKDLLDLGVHPRLAVLAGTDYFTADVPISQHNPLLTELFYNRISHGKIALFYASHPQRLFDNLRDAAANTTLIRPYYLGNYQQSAAFAPRSLSMKFSAWSEWKRNCVPHSLTFIVLFFFSTAAVLSSYRHASRPLNVRLTADTLLAAIGIAAVSFITPVIGDGLADIGKHLFLFDVIFDALFIAGSAWLLHAAIALLRTSRERYLRRHGPTGGSVA